MRIRAVACTAFACVLLFVNAFLAPTLVQAFSDADRDTIDDDLEFMLASQFYPVVWISNGDQCPNPDPRTVLFRARHPSVFGYLQTNFIVISYVQLYDRDCGDLSHNGDNEPFEVWLTRNGSAWEWGGVSAIAHWGTGNEERTWSYNREIWVGANKHGTYADPNKCGVPFSVDDDCGGLARVMARTLYNHAVQRR